MLYRFGSKVQRQVGEPFDTSTGTYTWHVNEELEPNQSAYMVEFTPEERAVIDERNLHNRLIFSLTPKGNLDDIERQIAKLQTEGNRVNDEIGRANQRSDLSSQDRITRMFDHLHDIGQQIERLRNLKEQLSDPNRLILIKQFLGGKTTYLAILNTAAEARQFEIDFEKALIQLQKYLQQFIPKPEEPAKEAAAARLPTQVFHNVDEMDFEIFQGVWVIGAPGTGKTNALQFMISELLQFVEQGKATVVIMDGQGKGQSLAYPFLQMPQYRSRLLYIDPRNPLKINPFRYRKNLEYRASFNATRGMLTYFMSGMIDQPLTSNHETILENALELMFRIPEATLYTLLDILNPSRTDLHEYESSIESIPDTFIRQFLRVDLFRNRIFAPRRDELVGRLYAMLRDFTFRTMFSDPSTPYHIPAIIDMGRLIVIDCDKNYLSDRTEMFGRFFISQIHRAALERSSYPPDQRKLPCFVFIDECHDFIARDERIYQILEQARKQNISVILANQFTSQITEPRVLNSLFSTTATKMVSRTSTDLSLLATHLHCTPEDILSAPKYHFVLHTTDKPTTYISFPPVTFDYPSEEEMQKLREKWRQEWIVWRDEAIRVLNGRRKRGLPVDEVEQVLANYEREVENPVCAPTDRRILQVGDWVQWEQDGVLQFESPRQITDFSDDLHWVFVEGSNTGLPLREVKLCRLGEDVESEPEEAIEPPVLPDTPDRPRGTTTW